MQILCFCSLMLRYTPKLRHHADVYKPLNLPDLTSMINNSSNYLYGREVGALSCTQMRGDVRERGWHATGQDDFKGRRLSAAVSAPSLLTKCSTKAGEAVCVCVCACVWVSLFVQQGPLMCEALCIICITCFNCTRFKGTCWNAAFREITSFREKKHRKLERRQ